MKGLAVCIFCLLVVIPSQGWAMVLGREGTTYPIHEKDMAELIRQRASEFDFETWATATREQMKERIKTFRPPDAVTDLPIADKGGAYRIDVSYTLPYNLHDAEGNLVYPQGYTFNPLEHMNKAGLRLSSPYVIVNAERPEELEWLKARLNNNLRGSIRILITNGHAYTLSQDLGVPVYYLSETLRSRLAVKYTPTVVHQPAGETRFLLANYFAIDGKGNEIGPSRKRIR